MKRLYQQYFNRLIFNEDRFNHSPYLEYSGYLYSDCTHVTFRQARRLFVVAESDYEPRITVTSYFVISNYYLYHAISHMCVNGAYGALHSLKQFAVLQIEVLLSRNCEKQILQVIC